MVGKRAPTEDRFWAKVVKGGPGGCWNWTGHHNGVGYGMLWAPEAGRKVLAHRFSYEMHHGPLPPGVLVCHHCDNPACVNPEHLYAGDYRSNMRDAVARGRHGYGIHKRKPDGTLVHPPPVLRGDAHPARKNPEIVRRGEDVGSAKMTADRVRVLWCRRLAGESFSALGRSFGLDPSSVSDICRGERWGHLLGKDGAPTLAELQAIPPGKSSKRLTEEVVLAIRAESASGKPDRAIAADRGLSVMTVYEIRQRRAWRHLP